MRPQHGPSVLVVDDDESVRTLVARMLEKAGYRVCQASDAWQALAVCREGSTSLDLVVTDVAMPQMDGFALGEILEALRPALPVLYMTGDPTVIRNLRERRVRAHWSFLLKPFTRAQLLGRVEQVVRSDAPAQ